MRLTLLTERTQNTQTKGVNIYENPTGACQEHIFSPADTDRPTLLLWPALECLSLSSHRSVFGSQLPSVLFLAAADCFLHRNSFHIGHCVFTKQTARRAHKVHRRVSKGETAKVVNVILNSLKNK